MQRHYFTGLDLSPDVVKNQIKQKMRNHVSYFSEELRELENALDDDDDEHYTFDEEEENEIVDIIYDCCSIEEFEAYIEAQNTIEDFEDKYIWDDDEEDEI